MQEIPCATNGQATWTQRTVLDGRSYQLTFDWSQREGVWLLTIATDDGAVIARGLRLVVGARLLEGHIDPLLPPGDIVLLDLSERMEEPGFSDLGGERFPLVYVQPSELA